MILSVCIFNVIVTKIATHTHIHMYYSTFRQRIEPKCNCKVTRMRKSYFSTSTNKSIYKFIVVRFCSPVFFWRNKCSNSIRLVYFSFEFWFVFLCTYQLCIGNFSFHYTLRWIVVWGSKICKIFTSQKWYAIFGRDFRLFLALHQKSMGNLWVNCAEINCSFFDWKRKKNFFFEKFTFFLITFSNSLHKKKILKNSFFHEKCIIYNFEKIVRDYFCAGYAQRTKTHSFRLMSMIWLRAEIRVSFRSARSFSRFATEWILNEMCTLDSIVYFAMPNGDHAHSMA